MNMLKLKHMWAWLSAN